MLRDGVQTIGIEHHRNRLVFGAASLDEPQRKLLRLRLLPQPRPNRDHCPLLQQRAASLALQVAQRNATLCRFGQRLGHQLRRDRRDRVQDRFRHGRRHQTRACPKRGVAGHRSGTGASARARDDADMTELALVAVGRPRPLCHALGASRPMQSGC